MSRDLILLMWPYFSSVVLMCIFSVALWGVALGALLVGGHGEVFVCRPLYDEPEFSTLTRLVDQPSVLFQRGGGFFSNLLYGNSTMDVPVRDVLQWVLLLLKATFVLCKKCIKWAHNFSLFILTFLLHTLDWNFGCAVHTNKSWANFTLVYISHQFQLSLSWSLSKDICTWYRIQISLRSMTFTWKIFLYDVYLINYNKI
jgi:hypothetical protein